MHSSTRHLVISEWCNVLTGIRLVKEGSARMCADIVTSKSTLPSASCDLKSVNTPHAMSRSVRTVFVYTAPSALSWVQYVRMWDVMYRCSRQRCQVIGRCVSESKSIVSIQDVACGWLEKMSILTTKHRLELCLSLAVLVSRRACLSM